MVIDYSFVYLTSIDTTLAAALHLIQAISNRDEYYWIHLNCLIDCKSLKVPSITRLWIEPLYISIHNRATNSTHCQAMKNVVSRKTEHHWFAYSIIDNNSSDTARLVTEPRTASHILYSWKRLLCHFHCIREYIVACCLSANKTFCRPEHLTATTSMTLKWWLSPSIQYNSSTWYE